MQIDLSVQNVVKKFGDFAAVNDVSFDVETGKFFSILGPSGCGKTTLLRMVAGFYEPSCGSIRIRGEEMAGVEPNRRPVNMVFQQLAAFPNDERYREHRLRSEEAGRKGRRTPEAGGRDFGKSRASRLRAKEDQPVSGGQKQRVALARCLVLRPVVLLLDEPLGALDLKLREQMKVELKKLQQQVGTTLSILRTTSRRRWSCPISWPSCGTDAFEQVDTPQNI